MATLAACSLAGTALGLYYYANGGTGSKRKVSSDQPGDASSQSMLDTHLSLYRAPTSFLEDLYFFVEGLRFFYGETLLKWKTADLLFGLYYTCQNNGPMPAGQLADIGEAGTVFGLDALAEGDTAQIEANIHFLQRMERCFQYNSCLRERRPTYRKRRILQKMNIEEADFLKQATSAGVLKPSYVLVRDHELENIVLVVRGTHSIKDAFTSLTGASKPHHVVDSNGVTLGYSHFGMLAAARWLKGELTEALEGALRDTPGYAPLIIGHSLGGGAAAMLTMMLREQGGLFENVQCLAIACPACMTMELAESCKGYVTTVVNGCDAIPMMSSGSADVLREEVMASEWYDEFHKDMRQYKVFRAFESTRRWVSMRQSVQVCGAEQGGLVAGLRGMVGRVTTGWWAEWTGRGGSDAEHESVREEDLEDRSLRDHGADPASTDERDEGRGDGQHIRGRGGGDRDLFFPPQHRSQQSTSDSLQAEAVWRRKAVQDAVLDAEAAELEDRQRSSDRYRGREGHQAEPHVPSIIRPGNYGDESAQRQNESLPSSSSSSRRGAWKRFMYPAGRIMHFVPAQVVPGYEDSVIADEEPFVDSPMDDLNDPHDVHAMGATGGPVGGIGSPLHSSSVQNLTRQPSELDFDDIMGGEGVVLHARTTSDVGPLPPLKPAPGPPPKNMVLVDNVPQRLYGRMRPSTSILADHVIPNYMRSLHSFRQRHWF